MKYVWVIVGLLYALLNLYTGYLLFTAGVGPKLAQKGIMLQAPPVLGQAHAHGADHAKPCDNHTRCPAGAVLSHSRSIVL